MAVLKKESKRQHSTQKIQKRYGEKMCPCVSVSQIRSKKYALGKGNLMSNKLRQILLNLLMETGKTEKAVIQSKGRRRLIKSDNI